ncbi:MAG: EamA family transporter [Sedimentisphaerales bacterium]|nr:EamA family transporter [Sedimentisphaerales bacterium]
MIEKRENMDWRILAAVTVLCWGTYNVILKAVSSRVSWQMSMMWFIIGYALVIAVFVGVNCIGREFRWFQPMSLVPLSAGVLCAIGAITFFKAIPTAPGSLLMPIIGLYVLTASIGCLVFLKEPITLRVVLGISFATAAILLLSK